MVLAVIGTAQAANLRWDFDGDPTIGTPAVATPGSGTWSTSVANWNDTSTLLDGIWSNGSSAQFGGGGGADGNYIITVDPSVTTLVPASGGGPSLQFVNSGFTLQGNSAVSINVAGTLSVSPNVTATIGNQITLTGVSTINTGKGELASGTGTLIIDSGGTVGNTGDLGIGNQAKIQIKTGGTLSGGRILVAGPGASELVVDGGTVTVTGATLFIGHAGGSQGGITLNSGAITTSSGTTAYGYLQFGPTNDAATAAAGGTFDLNGGTLTVAQIRTGAINNGFVDAIFNFNGGTVKAKAGTSFGTSFMTGLDVANVRNGGAIIDTNGQNITIGQALVHSTIGGDHATDGGLIKRGTGTLTLTGANTFTGNIAIEAGTLILASAFIDDNADVILLTGAVLNLNYAGTDSIGRLFIDGLAQDTGTYGAIGSGAENQSAFFTGAGWLNVTSGLIPEPSIAAALTGLTALALVTLRRRR